MKRLSSALALALFTAGCSVPETGLAILGAIPPDGETCVFSATGDIFTSEATFDSELALGLSVFFRVRNDLTGAQVDIGTMDNPRLLTPPNVVTPLDFDARWECDSNGFSTNVSALILPAFSPDPEQPFCLNRRSEITDFKGFDLVPASGGGISPNGGQGVVQVEAIPRDLGQAFDDLFKIAALADACCTVPNTGCSGTDMTPGGPCAQLAQAFATLDPDGTFLTVQAPSADQQSEDLITYAAFARFNGDHITARDPQVQRSLLAPSYPMRFRGFLEGLSGDGSLVRSTEGSIKINVCRSCGVLNPNPGVNGSGPRLPYYVIDDGMGGEQLDPQSSCFIN